MIATARAVLLLAWPMLLSTPAASATLVSDTVSVSARTNVAAKAFANLPNQCPPNFTLLSHAVTAGRPESTFILAQKGLVAGGTSPIVDGVHTAPIGVDVRVFNNGDASEVLDVQVLCTKFDAAYGASLVAGTVNVPTRGKARGVAACPDGSAATGGGYDAPTIGVQGHHPDWSLGAALALRPDGTFEVVDSWAAEFVNPGTTNQDARTYAYCYRKSTEMATTVATVQLQPGERRYLGISLSNFLFAISGGMSGNAEGLELSDGVWRLPEGNATDRGMNFTASPDSFEPAGGGIVGVFARDLRQAELSARATSPVTLAVTTMTTGEAERPTSIAQAIEFYNAARDHYFVTASPREIADLDSGAQVGWMRTNQSFKVYAAGSGGPLGRFPMCRFYGLPSAGLDSHFYTASVLECLDVAAKFAGAWLLESGAVFQVQLPNIVTGDCPPGTIPVFRTWNQRADSNHRYVTSLALRNQMLAQGHVAEGYGPNGVAFCVPA